MFNDVYIFESATWYKTMLPVYTVSIYTDLVPVKKISWALSFSPTEDQHKQICELVL